tara:strand:+ start:3539 stop:4153 length:615 start_codon:yes stop_codon:yes gene_type:complete
MIEHEKKTGPYFVTLGPAGTNHEFVTGKYLEYRGLKNAQIKLIDDFLVGLAMINNGTADYMIQVAVHPECANVVATAHFEYGIHVIDTFISPSKELGIVTRRDIKTPKTLALQPATIKYINVKKWEKLVYVNSIMHIPEGLLNGKYDSGLTTLEAAEKHKDQLRVDVQVGTVDDPWLVYGKCRVSNGNLVASSSGTVRQNLSSF